MDNDELIEKLKERGYHIGDAVVRDDGMMLFNVNDVFMFRLDAVDLANDTSTLQDVLKRNEGKVFPKAVRRQN